LTGNVCGVAANWSKEEIGPARPPLAAIPTPQTVQRFDKAEQPTCSSTWQAGHGGSDSPPGEEPQLRRLEQLLGILIGDSQSHTGDSHPLTHAHDGCTQVGEPERPIARFLTSTIVLAAAGLSAAFGDEKVAMNESGAVISPAYDRGNLWAHTRLTSMQLSPHGASKLWFQFNFQHHWDGRYIVVEICRWSVTKLEYENKGIIESMSVQ
jgi:hypothetical protein